MTITINIKGMRCPHCERRINMALSEIEGVEKCIASRENGAAILTLSHSVDKETIRHKLQTEGYQMID